ncbi:MAG: hypothetical protein ACI3VA_07145 [Candidatus Limivicinus sp.]
MQIISLILSGLALLAASVSLIFTIQEKKRSQKRNAAMLDYTERKFEYYWDQVNQKCIDTLREASESISEINVTLSNMGAKIQDLERGITPDYEQAKAAANAVNDFNRGISNILGFDPMAAVRKQREQERVGGEAE